MAEPVYVKPENLRAAADLTECNRLFPKVAGGTPVVVIELLRQAADTIARLQAEVKLLMDSTNYLRSELEKVDGLRVEHEKKAG